MRVPFHLPVRHRLAADEASFEEPQQPPAGHRRHILRVAALVAWGIVVALELSVAVANPSITNVVLSASLGVLFILVNLQLVLVRWIGQRHWRSLTGRLLGSAYLSEEFAIPNRNYALAELRREMPRARAIGHPFVIVQLTIEDIGGVA